MSLYNNLLLKDAEKADNPLHDFYTSPYKRGKLTNFYLIRLILDNSKINVFYKIFLLGIVNFLMIILSIILCNIIKGIITGSCLHFALS